jgi:hypothetical protein
MGIPIIQFRPSVGDDAFPCGAKAVRRDDGDALRGGLNGADGGAVTAERGDCKIILTKNLASQAQGLLQLRLFAHPNERVHVRVVIQDGFRPTVE